MRHDWHRPTSRAPRLETADLIGRELRHESVLDSEHHGADPRLDLVSRLSRARRDGRRRSRGAARFCRLSRVSSRIIASTGPRWDGGGISRDPTTPAATPAANTTASTRLEVTRGQVSARIDASERQDVVGADLAARPTGQRQSRGGGRGGDSHNATAAATARTATPDPRRCAARRSFARATARLATRVTMASHPGPRFGSRAARSIRIGFGFHGRAHLVPGPRATSARDEQKLTAVGLGDLERGGELGVGPAVEVVQEHDISRWSGVSLASAASSAPRSIGSPIFTDAATGSALDSRSARLSSRWRARLRTIRISQPEKRAGSRQSSRRSIAARNASCATSSASEGRPSTASATAYAAAGAGGRADRSP